MNLFITGVQCYTALLASSERRRPSFVRVVVTKTGENNCSSSNKLFMIIFLSLKGRLP